MQAHQEMPCSSTDTVCKILLRVQEFLDAESCPTHNELILPPMADRAERTRIHQAIQAAHGDVVTDSVIDPTEEGYVGLCVRVRLKSTVEAVEAANRTATYGFFGGASGVSTPPEAVADRRPIVICDGVSHSGNIGQIIRLCCNTDAQR
jgi:tRNA G18 (ribose-2'-O)-methylase SpoU